MSTAESSLILETAPSGPTVADVLALVPEMGASKQARQNIASSIRALCRVHDRPANRVPIYAPTFRKLMEIASPGAVRLSATRWRNVKSDVRRAIRLSGLSVDTYPEKAPLTDDWERVALMAPDPTRRSVLRRFGRFCSSGQKTPKQVDDGMVDQFCAYLYQNQLSKSPERTIKDVIRTWNHWVASDRCGTYRKLSTRSGKRSYTLSWGELPDGLAKDARAFKEQSQNPNYFDTDRVATAVRPATATQRDRMFRRLASAEILSGISPSDLGSLADLVHPDRLKPGLEFFIERNGGQPSKQTFDMAILALSIARHWTKLPESQIAIIADWVKRLKKGKKRQHGMTEKNRERLSQFSNEGVIRTFLTLPDRLLGEALKLPVDSRSALKVQCAVAVALLSIAPMRLQNLRCLDRNTHFRRAFSVENPHYQLSIPAPEVKNMIDLAFPVPQRIMKLVDIYLKNYQPLLTNGHPSSLLFPGRAGQPKCDSALRHNIKEVIYKNMGLHVNPHLFRHLGAYLFLKANPGQYESVRQLLGHKNIQTTINFYASFETDEAMCRFNNIIDAYRDGSDGEPPPKM